MERSTDLDGSMKSQPGKLLGQAARGGGMGEGAKPLRSAGW